MKRLNVYGVKMSELENMMFSKYVSNNSIAMNTLPEPERTKITQEWLDLQNFHSLKPIK
jgi:hypothetical protein